MPAMQPIAPSSSSAADPSLAIAHLSRQLRWQRRLLSGLGAAVAAALLVAAMQDPQASRGSARFDELTVQRINVVEPDGALRLVVSSRGKFPGDFDKGVESPRPDRRHAAGMLFLNDEGTECGGLIYGAQKDGQGGVHAGMSLTFDRYQQDQVLQLLHQEDAGFFATGVAISDRPDGTKYPIADLKRDVAAIEKLPPEQQQAGYAALQAAGKGGSQRAYLGTTRDQGSALMLCDAAGRPRVMLLVTADGEPKLQVLDDQGGLKGTFALTPTAPPAGR
jgi:hypothetical protein